MDPSCSLAAFNDYFQSNIECDKIQTIGGYVLERIQSIPTPGTTLKEPPFDFTVREANEKQLIKLRVRQRNK